MGAFRGSGAVNRGVFNMIACEQQPLRARDGVSLGWWRVAHGVHQAAQPRHLLLTHGMFSDRRVCMSLARAWARQGHVAWILEWRGHGNSESVADAFDIPAGMEALLSSAPGPVLLVDDLCDSRWSLAMAGRALRIAGAPGVLPFTLGIAG